jgi:hypothetical protein
MNDLSLWWNAARKAVEGENPECPRCNARRLDFQYVGDLESRLGYLDVWCCNCKRGTHISRVEVPEGVDMLPMGSSADVLRRRIPAYLPVEIEEEAASETRK